jgi:hypothetical protein
MSYCRQCGTAINDASDLFCSRCGTPLAQVASAQPASMASGGTAPPDTRLCPFCAEAIRAEATRCRFCRSNLPPLAAPVEIVGGSQAPPALESAQSQPGSALGLTPSSFADTAELAEAPVDNRYAWGLIVTVVLYFALASYENDPAGYVALSLLSIVNGVLTYKDLVNNDGEITFFRFVLAFAFIPGWLWIRARVLHTTRVHFWVYVAVCLLAGILRVLAEQ